MMKFFMVMMVAVGVCASSDEKNHNGEHHATLCGLLGAAVQKWKTTNHPGVKKALGQAIFGKPEGGTLEDLITKLPDEYNEPGNREVSCGKCDNGGDHYPGKSIPHDLLCLCTVGENGYPFIEHGSTTMLCGKNAADLGCEGDLNNNKCPAANGRKGWGKSGNVKHHLEKTWEKVVKHCLKNGSGLTLEEALRSLEKSFRSSGTPVWSATHSYDCGGESYETSICVAYETRCDKQYNNNSPQWWWHLEKALTTPNLTEAQLNSTTFLNASLDMDHNLEGVHGGHGVGTSSTSSSQQTGSTTHHPEEPSNRLASLFSKHDGTSLPHPLLCLLSAVSFF